MTEKPRFINIHPLKDRTDETNVSPEQQKKEERPWIFSPHEHPRRTKSDQAKTSERPETPGRLMPECYSPCERIRKKKDFINLYKKGVCARGRYFNLIILRNDLTHSRMAVVTSRKIGNAVERNRARRRARELFRRNKAHLAFEMDILLIAKKDVHSATAGDLRERYLEALQAISE